MLPGAMSGGRDSYESPPVQKKIIAACNRAVNLLSQLLDVDSMIHIPANQSEAVMLQNAIFDGPCVMLSGETAIGSFPVEAVKIMSRIALKAEEALEYRTMLNYYQQDTRETITDAISYAACRAAYDLNAAVIISATRSGFTARMVSKFKPKAPIIAVTPGEKVASALTLSWGVYPLLAPSAGHSDEIFNTAVKAALEAGLIKGGELVVLTGGVPVGVPGTTNFMRIENRRGNNRAWAGCREVFQMLPFVCSELATSFRDQRSEILVTVFTDKEFLPAIKKAGAIITETGLDFSRGSCWPGVGHPVIVVPKAANRNINDRTTGYCGCCQRGLFIEDGQRSLNKEDFYREVIK